jgi:hypothetical protein
MTALTWDQVGDRLYETGVDHGVLYIPDANGDYVDGYAWNGLTTVTESPSGAESNPQYADNIKYLNLVSAEEFGCTIEAFTYPDEFAQCDGTALPQAGVALGQQDRKQFGLVYRTRLGNDVDGTSYGYKLHLVYGCQAAPSEKAYATINDSPEAIAFSWEVTTTAVPVSGYKPVALITVDSTLVDPADLTSLEDLLFGSAGGDAQLPDPDTVIALFGAGVTTVDLGTAANQPTYVSGTHIVTLPTVTGVQWKVNGVNKAPGAQPALTTGQTAHVEATPTSPSYVLTGDTQWDFDY